ncbi:MAG: hypothetical protein KA383_13565 [Phycisphaerae bacterium]|nr:hypothetical protein [Phycisphaerae bacterium]
MVKLQTARRMVLSSVLLATLTGCGTLFDDSALFLVGTAGDTVYLQNFGSYSGYTTLPSTLWGLDLSTGDATKLQAARVQYDVQAAGDYFVAERPMNDNHASRIVAVQISTGAELTILERNVSLGGRYDRAFVLTGARVVARTETGLLVYDLATRAIERTVAVDDPIVEILAADAHWALVTRNSVPSGDHLLVRLDTGAARVIPAEPAGRQALFFDAAIVGEELFTGASLVDENGLAIGNEILALDLDDLTWETWATYDAYTPSRLSSRAVYVCGADETRVLVEYLNPLASDRVEVITRATGARTTLTEQTGIFTSTLNPRLEGDRVYWLSSLPNALVVHDLVSAARDVVSFVLQ